ncbi:MAG: Rab family GTPase [Candidatus Helarchaeota archaeon]
MSTENKYTFKILLLGDGAVGKTSLLRRFIDNTFDPDYKGTIGVQFMTREVIINDNIIKLVIWDVAGQAKMASFRHLYYKDAEGIILVYDTTRRETFENLDKWVLDAIKYTNIDTKIAVLANKKDLEHLRNVLTNEGEKYSNHRSAVIFSETSAKTGENVENAFIALARHIMSSYSYRYGGAKCEG